MSRKELPPIISIDLEIIDDAIFLSYDITETIRESPFTKNEISNAISTTIEECNKIKKASNRVIKNIKEEKLKKIMRNIMALASLNEEKLEQLKKLQGAEFSRELKVIEKNFVLMVNQLKSV